MALHTELPIYRTGVRLLSLAVKVQEQMGTKMPQPAVPSSALPLQSGRKCHE